MLIFALDSSFQDIAGISGPLLDLRVWGAKRLEAQVQVVAC